MAEPSERQEGVFASLRRLLRTGLAISQNRIELFLVELQEERWRLFDDLLLAGVVLILTLMTLLTATVAIAFLCVRADRLNLLGGLILAYLAATIVGIWRLRARLGKRVLFSATLAELKKDKACLDDKG